MKKFFLILLFGGLFSTFYSCSTYFKVSLDSYGKNPDKREYFIASTNPNVSIKDPEFEWYSNYINYSLSKQGYVQSNNEKTASLIILFDFGISDPKEKVISVPIIGQVGTGVYETSGKIDKKGNYTATTKEKTKEEVVGYENQKLIQYSRYLNIYCFDFDLWRNQKKEVTYWKIFINSVGRSGNLRAVFPYLVYAAQFYYGKSSGSLLNLEIEEGSDELYDYYGWSKN